MRKRFLCQFLPKPHQPVVLSDKEAQHALKVFRLRDGASLEAIDGQGHQAVVTLRSKGGPARLEYQEPSPTESPLRGQALSLPLVLEVAILKGEAMEWVVEKSVELGVRELAPLVTDHTVVQVKNKGPQLFQERWQKIADQALKQCGRLNRMSIRTPISLADRLTETASQNIRLWSDELDSAGKTPHLANVLDSLSIKLPGLKAGVREGRAGGLNPGPLSGGDPPRPEERGFPRLDGKKPQDIMCLIGPEGGWSIHERDMLLSSTDTLRVTLGPLILRSETAAIYSIGLLNAHFQKTEK